MPLNKDESKKILLNAFRLAIAVSEKRADDATLAYSNILDSTLYADDSDDDMPSLIPLANPESNINLVISEIEQGQKQPLHVPYSFSSVPSAFASVPPAYASVPDVSADADSYEDEALVEELGHEKSDTESDEEVEVAKGVATEEEEGEEEEEEGEEEEVGEEEEEVEELELEPVRIKKVIYWKDSKSGDIYVCLPEDEVGDKVGRYVDGKPVFD
jgi:hypothetical protein